MQSLETGHRERERYCLIIHLPHFYKSKVFSNQAQFFFLNLFHFKIIITFLIKILWFAHFNYTILENHVLIKIGTFCFRTSGPLSL